MFRNHLGWGIAACLAGAAQAQGASDGASAASAARATFEFAQVRSLVQPSDVVGHAHSGVFCGGEVELHASNLVEQTANTDSQFAFRKLAKELDVPMFVREVSPFDTETTTGADFRLGGVLQRLHIDACDDGGTHKGSAELEVKWEVFSARQQRVVLSKVVKGEYRTDDYVSGPLEARAYVNSLHRFMASDEFKALADAR